MDRLETVVKAKPLRRREANLPAQLYKYRLVSVITHQGKLDNGHYWASVSSGCEWYRLDDDKGQHINSKVAFLADSRIFSNTYERSRGA
jgi:ubiquitin C-terminal hydrolase